MVTPARDSALSNFPLTNVDLTNFDVAAMLASDPGRAARALAHGVVHGTTAVVREATYVTVGLTVLGIRRANALRHSATRTS